MKNPKILQGKLGLFGIDKKGVTIQTRLIKLCVLFVAERHILMEGNTIVMIAEEVLLKFESFGIFKSGNAEK